MILAAILYFLFPASSMAVDYDCNYYQDMEVGPTYYVFNKEYPKNYGPNTVCQWIAISPNNTKISIECQIEIPNSHQCSGDRLLISLSGNTEFSDAHQFCGTGPITDLFSINNSLSIGLFVTPTTTGGRFLCTIKASIDSCNCGWKQNNKARIVGGHETGVNEYPAMAGLIDLETRSYHCGATILSNRYVLTAAHCVNNKHETNLAVIVGDHDFTSGKDTPYSKLYRTEKLIVHSDFDQKNFANDIALVKTKNEIEFSAFVGPICLPTRYLTESFNGETVTALGWGTTGSTQPKSDTLQEVDLNVLDMHSCATMLPDRSITSNQICTYRDGKNMCHYDSGGPILWMDLSTQRLQLVGIISYGDNCASDEPSVNTRVTSYLGWIFSMTEDTKICIM